LIAKTLFVLVVKQKTNSLPERTQRMNTLCQYSQANEMFPGRILDSVSLLLLGLIIESQWRGMPSSG